MSRRTGLFASMMLGVILFLGCAIEPKLLLKDEQQEENLSVLSESYDKIYKDLTGNPDANGQPQTQPKIPAKAVLDSHKDLLKEALELEKSKKESWQEQARSRGWQPK